MSDELGNRGSRGNIMKAINRVIKLLEDNNDLLRQLVNKDRSFLRDDEEYVEKVRDTSRYSNRTGTKKGSL